MGGRDLPRILIVDDDADMARSLARVFGEEAHVTSARSGAEALEGFERGERYDLVLCDVMMPGMTGIELFERMQARDPTTASAFVFATGGVPPEYEQPLRATGARRLDKPCALVDLRRLLDDCRMRR